MKHVRLKEIPVRLLSGLYRIPICSKGTFEGLKQCETAEEYASAAAELTGKDDIPECDRMLLVLAYIESIEQVCSGIGLEIPFYPVKPEKDDIKYTIYTQLDKLAADYSGLDIYSIDEIPIIDYRLIVRDAVISKLSQTEKGREYLNNAYRLTCTEADEDLE